MMSGTVGRLRERSSREDGETLMELMVTVTLLGVVIVGLVAAVLNLIVTSDNNRRHTRLVNEAVTMAENVRAATYQPCTVSSPTPQVTFYTTAAGVAPSGATVSVRVKFLTSRTATAASASPAAFQTTCPAAGDQGIQQITLGLTSSGSTNVTETLTVTKRVPT